jgi:hypothetical protein
MIILLISSLLITKNNFGQDNKLVQFSGVVVSADSLTPMPFANVIIKGSFRGTITDFYGFFSFVAQLNDTIEFSSIGYKTSYYAIPDTLPEERYSLIQILKKDTISLNEAVIYPWPTREQFKTAFLNMDIPFDDYERARRNLDPESMYQRLYSMTMDANSNYKYNMQQYQSRVYYNGQLPPSTIGDPFAWVRFIDAWKKGKLKDPRKR